MVYYVTQIEALNNPKIDEIIIQFGYTMRFKVAMLRIPD